MEKQTLYQVRVLTGEDRAIDVGPKMIKQFAEMFCDAIKMRIREGKEKVWKEPIYYPVYE